MTDPTHRLLSTVLTLPEDERLEIATEIVSSVDGPPDAKWDELWQAEVGRREQAARERSTPAPEWAEVRARVLRRVTSR